MPLVDEPNTDFAEKEWANRATVRLYDPPAGGKTPADGAGTPANSAIPLRDREAKLAQGFTTEVVGWDEEWPVLGNAPVRPGAPFAVEPLPQAVVAEKKTRARTVKR